MEIGPQILRLKERGDELILTPSQWALVEDNIQELSSMGIVGLRSTATYRVVKPQQFVGRLRTAAGIVEIQPRNGPWFADLQQLVAFRPDKRLPTLEGETTSGTITSFADLAVAFYKVLQKSLRMGLPQTRRMELVVTSTPKGRMLFNASVRRLFAHGVRHKVVCARLTPHYDEELASVIRLAVLLASQLAIPDVLKRNLDILTELVIKDSRQISVSEGKAAVDVLRRRYSEWPEIRELLAICAVIFSSNEPIWDIEVALAKGDARFCDVDRLWELAILTGIRSVLRLGLTAEFHPYARTALQLLSDGGPQIDPDIVIYNSGVPSIVLDGKNSFATSANASDVYQITCYVEKLNAESGSLIYLSAGENWIQVLGKTNSGKQISAVGISTKNATESLKAGVIQLLNR